MHSTFLTSFVFILIDANKISEIVIQFFDNIHDILKCYISSRI